MDRFNKIWTTAMMTVLSGVGLGIILGLADPPIIGVVAYSTMYMFLIAVTFIANIIAHEGGHLLGGLLSGYEFVSFRVFNIMIVKRNGKLLRKKFHLVGTGGQCLMAPPHPYRVEYPYKLYNLAGGLINLLVAAVSIALCISLIGAGTSLIGLILILIPLAVTGIYCGVTNLVPMIIGGVPNDGHNLANLVANPTSRWIFWRLLDVMAIITRGGQARDLPEEWFDMDTNLNQNAGEPSSANPQDNLWKGPDFSDSFQCSFGIYRFNYLEDTGRLTEAEALAEKIIATGKRVPQLYRFELLCESIFLELIGQCRLDRVELLYTSELERYIRATASYPQRQRLHYAMDMLYYHDEESAAESLSLFENACKTYPNEGEISSEWELIGLVDCKLAEINGLAQQAAEAAQDAAEEAAQIKLEDLASADTDTETDFRKRQCKTKI